MIHGPWPPERATDWWLARTDPGRQWWGAGTLTQLQGRTSESCSTLTALTILEHICRAHYNVELCQHCSGTRVLIWVVLGVLSGWGAEEQPGITAPIQGGARPAPSQKCILTFRYVGGIETLELHNLWVICELSPILRGAVVIFLIIKCSLTLIYWFAAFASSVVVVVVAGISPLVW